MVYLAGFLGGRARGSGEGAVGSGSGLHFPSKGFLRVVIAVGLVLPGVVQLGWSAPAPQVVAAPHDAATVPQTPALTTQGSGTAPQEPAGALQTSASPERSKLGAEATSLTIPRLAHAPALDDFLHMKPEGETALQMARVTGFVQRNPHDGEAVSEGTDAYLGYDQKNLYVVFVCFDTPKRVRARMSRREDVGDDDQVEVILDTFHDKRRAYAFQATPLGVQWDAIWTEAARDEVGGHFDTSFDTVWDSRGKVTDRGYVVWLAIPFKSLRFPAGRQQEWGIILYRGIVRKSEDTFWPHISYKNSSRLEQAATLKGLEGISPGRSIELLPYGVMRGFRGLDTRDPATPYFQKATAQGQPGMDAKFVLHDHFVVDMTANPDFSQVESEDPQITVNQRFQVYFPEKRPFFLENEDYFRTPIDLFFTRSISAPSAGIRLTGKAGPYSVGLMTTDDRSPGLVVPDSDPLSGTRSYFTVARASRDIFGQSSVGVIYTDWEYPVAKEFNRVGGIDTRLKLNAVWTLEGQAVVSSSNLGGGYQAGPADRLELRRDGRHFSYDGTYDDVSPGFTTVPGFVNRVDVRSLVQSIDYRFRPKRGWVVDWGPSVTQRLVYDHEGNRLDTDYSPYLAIQGRGQTFIWIFPYEELRERLRPQDFSALGFSALQSQDYHEHDTRASIQTSYFPKVTIGAGYNWGDGVNFVASPNAPAPFNQPFLARQDLANAVLSFRPVKPLKIENTYLFERLRTIGADASGGNRGIFNNHIVRSKWNWQFTPQLSLRMILQYNSLLANTPGEETSSFTSLPTSRQFNADFLITYLVHPGTAVYIGYNSDLQNLNVVPGAGVFNTARGYINDSRQFFVKVSYQFRF